MMPRTEALGSGSLLIRTLRPTMGSTTSPMEKTVMEDLDEISVLKARLAEAEGRISIMHAMLRRLFSLSSDDVQIGLERGTRRHMVTEMAAHIGRPEAHRFFMEMFPDWKPAGKHREANEE